MAVNLLPAHVPIGFVNGDQKQPIYASPELVRAFTAIMQQLGGQSTASPGDVTNLTAVGIEQGIRISGTLPTPTPDDVEVWVSSDNSLTHAVMQTHGKAATWDWIGLTAADGVKYIWVRCVFKSGKKGNFVGPVSAEAGINAIPNPVTGLAATSIIGGIRISGTLPSDIDLAGVEIWENTVNNVTTATLRTSGLADHYDRTGLLPTSGTYYFWARTFNTSGARGTFVGPVSGVAGQVAAGNIATGAVQVAAFASGIEPVTIVSAVPGTLGTKTIFNTTDGKLYRWNGTSYVKTMPTTDLSGQIAAGQIAANAVTAGTIAANAVTAGTIAAAAVSTNELSSSAIFAGSLAVNGTSGISLVQSTSSGTAVATIKLDSSSNLVFQGTAANKSIKMLAPNSGGLSVDDFTTVGSTALNVSQPGSTTTAASFAVGSTILNILSAGTRDLGLNAGGAQDRTIYLGCGAWNVSGAAALTWNSRTIAAPTGGTTTFLRNDGTWAVPTGSGVTSVTASSSTGGLTLSSSGGTTPAITLSGTPTSATQLVNGIHTYTFSGGNVTGSTSATFSGTKPGTTAGNNGWMLFVIDGTSWYVPIWQA
jgi:hypothetical protein